MEFIQEAEIYKGIPIRVDEEDHEYHVGKMYTGYKTVAEARVRIDEILAARVERQKYVAGQEGVFQVFDECRGDCLEINGELFTIHTLRNVPDDHKELEGKEYIYPHNPYGCEYIEANILRRMFSGRLKDAVEAIRNGYGDFIQGQTILGNHSDHVIRLLDRELGEKLRAEFIEGFKTAEFITYLRFNLTAGFGYGYDIGEGNTLVNGFWRLKYEQPKTFADDKEAHEYQEQLDAEIQRLNETLTEEQFFKMLEDDKQRDTVVVRAIAALRRYAENPESGAGYNFEICQTIKR